MKYAVVRIKGHQYKVKEGEEILVDLVGENDLVVETLLLVDEASVEVGKPLVAMAKIKIKNLGEKKGEKIYVSKYKAKSRYRKRTGFRPKYTQLLVEKIT